MCNEAYKALSFCNFDYLLIKTLTIRVAYFVLYNTTFDKSLVTLKTKICIVICLNQTVSLTVLSLLLCLETCFIGY